MSPSTGPQLLADPLARLGKLLQSGGTRRIVVGLVGLPGSGKSTVAGRLAEEINSETAPDTAVALGMDGFHYTRARLATFPDPAQALLRRGSPWTFDAAALKQRLRMLRTAPMTPETGDAGEVRWPGFQHGVGDPVEDAIAIRPGTRLVILEGLYLLHRTDGWDLRDLLDECWFLDVPMAVALDRLAARHMASWGWSRERAMDRIAQNDGLNAQTVLATQPLADWLVAN